mmetsp:Transcript_25286/g.43133  ORF Transcript_25286/g.43133 Transcript_25286/m.43133 type:complete len:772 (+) Transcript_25286:148-2463(+)
MWRRPINKNERLPRSFLLLLCGCGGTRNSQFVQSGWSHSWHEPIVPQQRLYLRLPPPERAEHLPRRHAPAQRQHRGRELAALGADRGVVPEPRLLERAEGVRAQHLGPQVAVVPRRVPAREDVREPAQEAVLVNRRHDRGQLRDALFHREHPAGRPRNVARVQLQVRQREVALAQVPRAAAEVLGRHELLVQGIRQRLARLEVLADGAQHFFVVAPVLHKLRGELHRVPLHLVDPRHRPAGLRREHVLQRVPKLVKKSRDLAVRHERGLAPYGRGAVAHHVRGWEAHGEARRRHGGAAAHDVGHPRPAALLCGARERVEVEVRARGAVGVEDLEEAHVLVPHLRLPVRGRHRDAEQRPREGEHPVDHRGELEVRAQVLLLELVLGFAQALAPEPNVPLHQPAGGFGGVLRGRERAHLFQLALRRGPGPRAHGLQERFCGRESGHLLRHGHLCKGAVPEQRRFFGAEGQDRLDQLRVVAAAAAAVPLLLLFVLFLLVIRRQLSFRWRLDLELACTREVSAVHLLAQRSVLGVQFDRQVRRRVEGEHPRPRRSGRARLPALGDRGRRRHLERGVGQTVHVGFLGSEVRKGLGGVEHVVAELCAQRGELGGDLVVPRLRAPVQRHAAELRVPHLALNRPSLRRGQRAPCACIALQCHKRVVHRPALPDAQRCANHRGLASGVRFPQRLAVLDALQVGHDAPRPGELLTQAFERVHEIAPRGGRRGGERGLERLDLDGHFRHRGVDRGPHVLGLDATPAGEIGSLASRLAERPCG